jgi:hypothetical protein
MNMMNGPLAYGLWGEADQISQAAHEIPKTS